MDFMICLCYNNKNAVPEAAKGLLGCERYKRKGDYEYEFNKMQ